MQIHQSKIYKKKNLLMYSISLANEFTLFQSPETQTENPVYPYSSQIH